MILVVTKIDSKKVIYAFSKDHEPIQTINAGTTIEIATYDCFENQVQSAETIIDEIDWNRINPATGPIYINDAKPGDILKVTIEKIDIAAQGVLATGPNLGVMGHRLKKMETKMISIDNNYALFNDKIKIPLNKMIGVIGVAPEGEPISCGTPGAHGGNMDTKLIEEGATIYFPIFTEGALFALGDFHAAMGDGEVCGSGVEIAGKATLTLDVIKTKSIEHPILTNKDGISFIVSAETLDAAIQTASETAIDFLRPHTDLTLAEFTMLMSAVGQTEISQIVDPLMTVRFSIPQYILDAYTINLFA